MSELTDYVKRNSKTFTLQDGDSAIATYRGYKIGANKYDPEKEAVYYQLETEFGIKTFQSSALVLANTLYKIPKGTEVRITRTGEGNKTTYAIEKKENGVFVRVGRHAEEED